MTKRQDEIDVEIARKRLAELEADPDSVIRGEALEERLREKPTSAAMRAANSIRASYCIGPISAESVGHIIDKETGLPEMVEALVKHRYGHKLVLGAEMTCCRYCEGNWNIHTGTTDCLPDCIISKAKGESP